MSRGSAVDGGCPVQGTCLESQEDAVHRSKRFPRRQHVPRRHEQRGPANASEAEHEGERVFCQRRGAVHVSPDSLRGSARDAGAAGPVVGRAVGRAVGGSARLHRWEDASRRIRRSRARIHPCDAGRDRGGECLRRSVGRRARCANPECARNRGPDIPRWIRHSWRQVAEHRWCDATRSGGTGRDRYLGVDSGGTRPEFIGARGEHLAGRPRQDTCRRLRVCHRRAEQSTRAARVPLARGSDVGGEVRHVRKPRRDRSDV